jgi:hypothetical protein
MITPMDESEMLMMKAFLLTHPLYMSAAQSLAKRLNVGVRMPLREPHS